MSGFIPRHGLTRNTKRLVFDALYQRQQGKCFICGVSQDELEEKFHEKAIAWAEHRKKELEKGEIRSEDFAKFLEENEDYAKWYEIREKNERNLSQEELVALRYRRNTVHWKLHIDHCHWSGRIRGLLCGSCNIRLGNLENYGFREKPDDMSEYDFADRCEIAGRWLEENEEIIFRYMQRDRWLPQKDILFHLQLQEQEVSA
jgi:hypothetical protein